MRKECRDEERISALTAFVEKAGPSLWWASRASQTPPGEQVRSLTTTWSTNTRVPVTPKVQEGHLSGDNDIDEQILAFEQPVDD